MEFGPKVKIIRQKIGLTLQELADELGVSISYIQYVESNKRIFSKKKLFHFIFFASEEKDVEIDKDEFFELYRANKKITVEQLREEYNNFKSEKLDTKLFYDNFEKENLGAHIFKSPLYNINDDQYFNFPVNDLAFHLKDTLNNKYYGLTLLDDNDKSFINNIIKQYLINKLVNRKSNIEETIALAEKSHKRSIEDQIIAEYGELSKLESELQALNSTKGV